MTKKTQLLSRNIEQFKKENNLLNNIEQIKKNKNLLQNKLEQFKKALWNRKQGKSFGTKKRRDR